MTPLVILLILLVFISAAETAFISLSQDEIGRLKRQHTKASLITLSLFKNSKEFITTTLIVNTLIKISLILFISVLMYVVIKFDSLFVSLSITFITSFFILLLFGEVIPKIIATQYKSRVIKSTTYPLNFLCNFFRPISFILISSSKRINDALTSKKVELSIEHSPLKTDESKKMLNEMIRFGNTEVYEIMQNRLDVVALDITSSFEKVKETIVTSGFSRIPIYEENLDYIKGILYAKDIIHNIDKDEFKWQSLLRQAHFVPDNKKINVLLTEFQKSQVHLAIVVDQYGSTEGLVSLEDILEEIVGEISDESDTEEHLYTKNNDGTFIFKGKTHLTDFEHILGINDGSIDAIRGEAETIAGLMLEINKEFLKIGDSVETTQFIFTVTNIIGRRIDKIKVERKPIV